jgi:hypothetical protein
MTTKDYLAQLERNTKEDLALVTTKSKDYADHDNPFKNFELSSQISGVPVAQGIMVRLADKMVRAANLLTRENVVKDEKIDDTLRDMRNYSNILSVYLENK